MVAPVDIAHVRSRNLLIITWEDGVVSDLPGPYLRGWCPCAGCQGHSPRVEFHEPTSLVTIEGLYEMGAYALAVRFSDGHDTGIYTWSWLRRISAEAEPRGLKRGAFLGDTYAPTRHLSSG